MFGCNDEQHGESSVKMARQLHESCRDQAPSSFPFHLHESLCLLSAASWLLYGCCGSRPRILLRQGEEVSQKGQQLYQKSKSFFRNPNFSSHQPVLLTWSPNCTGVQEVEYFEYFIAPPKWNVDFICKEEKEIATGQETQASSSSGSAHVLPPFPSLCHLSLTAQAILLVTPVLSDPQVRVPSLPPNLYLAYKTRLFSSYASS